MSRTANLKGAIERSREANPVVSAAIVAHHTDDPEIGGATVFNDRRIMAVGEGAPRGWAVGGESDTSGRQIPTQTLRGAVTPLDAVLSAQSRIYRQTGGQPDTGLGTWRTNDRVDLDASRLWDVPRSQALRMANRRGEKSVFSPPTFETPYAKYGKGEKTRAAQRRKALKK